MEMTPSGYSLKYRSMLISPNSRFLPYSSVYMAVFSLIVSYEVDFRPFFFFNRATNVRLYHDFSLKLDRLPGVIKRYDICIVEITK